MNGNAQDRLHAAESKYAHSDPSTLGLRPDAQGERGGLSFMLSKHRSMRLSKHEPAVRSCLWPCLC